MRKQAKEKGRNSSQGIRRLALVAIVVAVLALGVAAAVSLRTSQAKNSTAGQNNSQPTASTRANTRTSTQPMSFALQTGQVRPLTQEEAQKLAEGIKEIVNQSTDGLKSVRHADGSVSMDLEGRFQSVALAKRDEDGKLVMSCVDNRQSAAAFFGIDPQLVGVQGSGKTIPTVAEKGGEQ
jgi:hypothetical protein